MFKLLPAIFFWHKRHEGSGGCAVSFCFGYRVLAAGSLIFAFTKIKFQKNSKAKSNVPAMLRNTQHKKYDRKN